MEEKRLRLALFVAIEFGGERGEIVESAFLRGHPEPECAPKTCQRQFHLYFIRRDRPRSSAVKPAFSISHPRSVS